MTTSLVDDTGPIDIEAVTAGGHPVLLDAPARQSRASILIERGFQAALASSPLVASIGPRHG